MSTTKTPVKTQNIALPIKLKAKMELKNRLGKSATSEAMADRNTGRPSRELIQLYSKWAQGGAGLLITGNMVIDSNGRTEPGNVIIEDEEFLPELTAWAKAVKKEGAQLWMQINHSGRQATLKVTSSPVAPSSVGVKGMPGMFGKPRALSEVEIKDFIERYAEAARIAEKAGFDGVQVHGAHGYLVSQFLSPLVNKRTDKWGGSPENRRRFLMEIVKRIKSKVSPDFGVSVKLNSADFQRGGFSQDESADVIQALDEEGIDFIEISGGSYESAAMMGLDKGKKDTRAASTKAREAYFLEFAERIRAATDLPIMLTGGMRSVSVMNEVIESGAVDIVGIVRPVCVDPNLPNKFLSGEVEASFIDAPKFGVKLLDNMLQLVWFQEQFHKIAKSGTGDEDLNKWTALVKGYFKSYATSPATVLLAQLQRR